MISVHKRRPYDEQTQNSEIEIDLDIIVSRNSFGSSLKAWRRIKSIDANKKGTTRVEAYS